MCAGLAYLVIQVDAHRFFWGAASRWMAMQLKAMADKHCGGRLLAVHEGGYSEVGGVLLLAFCRKQLPCPGWYKPASHQALLKTSATCSRALAVAWNWKGYHL